MSLTYTISKEVFEKFPDYCRGVVVARGVRNGKSPIELRERLKAAEVELRSRLSLETLLDNPNIRAWREAYRSLGVKPADYRPSVEAMVRRILKNDPLPSINAIVDIGNLLSIRHLTPVGAHAIDVLECNIELRWATGEETFEPFGSEAVEHPDPGEVVFAELNTVLTRRWTWRQAKHTLVVPETTSVEVNVDGLPPVTQAEVGEICKQAVELLQHYCGGVFRYEILSAANPRMTLD